MATAPKRTDVTDPVPEASARDASRDVVRRAQQGDVQAFERLYRENAGRVFAICLRMTGDRERADELAQDVFVRVWERLHSFRGDSAFSTWVHRLAVNVILEQARSARRRLARVGLAEDEGVPDAPARGRSIEDAIDLERAIAALPPGARTVFVLHDIEGYQHREISSLTGSAEGTLRAQLHRARRLLMEALGK